MNAHTRAPQPSPYATQLLRMAATLVNARTKTVVKA